MKSTLLITTFNRSHLLNKSLERLTRLTLPDDILIVDDGSIDNTFETVENFKNRLPIRYIYNHNPKLSICSFARNIGLKNIDSDIIITSEPEIFFVTDVVKQMLEQHQQKEKNIITSGVVYHQGVQGNICNNMMENPIEQLKKESTLINESLHNTIPNNSKGYAKIKNWSATFVALYRREWLMDINGWDEEFPGCYGFDDIDLCTRLNRYLNIGQIISQEIETIHQYHGQSPDIGNAVIINSKYFEQKQCYDNPEKCEYVANKNKEWGVLKTR